MANPSPLVVSKDNENCGQNSNSGLSERKVGDFENLTKDMNPILSVGDCMSGWDKVDGAARGLQVGQGTWLEGKGIFLSLAGEQLKPGEEAMLANIFKKGGPCIIEPGVSSPVKVNEEAINDPVLNVLGPCLEAKVEPISKGKWKKIAREKGKAWDVDMRIKGPDIGNKRVGCIEDLLVAEGRSPKKACGGESGNNGSDSVNETVVTARQHR